MSGKPTLAIVNLTGCTGCFVSIVDLHEELLDVLGKVDLVYCPTILDIKEIPSCDIALVNGTVCNEHDVEMLKDVEKKAKTIIALGSCACFGGIVGLRNYFGREETLDYGYKSTPSNDSDIRPSEVVPKLTEDVEVVENIIRVDHKVPGCPPVPGMIKNALIALLEGRNLVSRRNYLFHRC